MGAWESVPVNSLFQSLSFSEEFDLIAVLALACNNSYQWRIQSGGSCRKNVWAGPHVMLCIVGKSTSIEQFIAVKSFESNSAKYLRSA
jgi:hypothetical protein